LKTSFKRNIHVLQISVTSLNYGAEDRIWWWDGGGGFGLTRGHN